MSDLLAQVHVDRNELCEALALLADMTATKKDGEAVIGCEDNQLFFQFGGGRVSIAAIGKWGGEVRADGSFISPIAQRAPEQDPFPISVQGDELVLASYRIPCCWQSSGTAKIRIPVDAPLLVLLRADRAFAEEELERSGLLKPIIEARKECASIIADAAKQLAPLGVELEDIEEMVETSIGKVDLSDSLQ